MRIAVDPARCEGHASCVMTAPTVFDLDDEGRAEVLEAALADHDAEAVDAAVRFSPTRPSTSSTDI
jgi:ferredoxin